MAAPKRNRFFESDEKVRVRKKTHLLDKERKHEGIPKGVKAQPIDEDVTGIEGRVEGGAYQSPTKGGEWMVPIRVGNGGVISVPESRLERVNNTPKKERSHESGPSAMSQESISFWRSYFRKEEELKRLRKKTKKG